MTWRLAGTLPRPGPHTAQKGPRWLENPAIAALFVEALLYGERVRGSYDLFAWAVMPNHVHIVLKPHEKLPEVVRWMTTASAARANRLTGRTGQPFWQREYFDTWMRTSQELASVIAYVEENPVTAGLALRAEDWPWSSASKYTGGETAGAPKMQKLQTQAEARPVTVDGRLARCGRYIERAIGDQRNDGNRVIASLKS